MSEHAISRRHIHSTNDLVSFSCRVNTQLHQWILANHKGTIPVAKRTVTSPFEGTLVKLGYKQKEGNTDSDSDDSFIMY